ncbi:MAG: SPFH domain-containing protein [Lachnospiraceae bacterium]|nr:SPFH domain-containing protein [Lachnospiraceae bacterium]
MAFNLKNLNLNNILGDQGDDPKPANPILSVIKNNSRNGELCYKVPSEDFNTGAQLIVAEYEEALFMKDGIIEEVFAPGKYTLTTQNYPFLTRFLTGILSNGESPFNCKVYYINKSHHLELKWGTTDPIRVLDPVLGIDLQISARGAYSVAVSNGKKFFLKLVGGNGGSIQTGGRKGNVDEEAIKNSFKTAFKQNITDELAAYLTQGEEEVMVVLNRKKALAESLKAPLNEILDEYGMELVNFYIENIQIPENDPYMQRIREMRISRQEKMFDREQTLADNRLQLGINREAADTDRYVSGQQAQADYERMRIRDQDGNNGWARQEASDIMKTAAANEGEGGFFMQAGIGLGMGSSIGQAAGNMVNNLYSQNGPGRSAGAPTICGKCGAAVPEGMKFCGSCGSPVEAPVQTCANCGAQIPAGMKFCGVCGSPVGPVKRVCSRCGAELMEGMKFCGICGNKEI